MSMDASNGSHGVLPLEHDIRGKLVNDLSSIGEDYVHPPVGDEENPGCDIQVRARGIQERKTIPPLIPAPVEMPCAGLASSAKFPRR